MGEKRGWGRGRERGKEWEGRERNLFWCCQRLCVGGFLGRHGLICLFKKRKKKKKKKTDVREKGRKKMGGRGGKKKPAVASTTACCLVPGKPVTFSLMPGKAILLFLFLFFLSFRQKQKKTVILNHCLLYIFLLLSNSSPSFLSLLLFFHFPNCRKR